MSKKGKGGARGGGTHRRHHGKGRDPRYFQDRSGGKYGGKKKKREKVTLTPPLPPMASSTTASRRLATWCYDLSAPESDATTDTDFSIIVRGASLDWDETATTHFTPPIIVTVDNAEKPPPELIQLEAARREESDW